jgi:hypothetical protein
MLTQRLIDWAQWEWQSALRESPEMCKGRGVPLGAVAKAPVPSQIAFHYLDYVFGNDVPRISRRFCDRMK